MEIIVTDVGKIVAKLHEMLGRLVRSDDLTFPNLAEARRLVAEDEERGYTKAKEKDQ